MSLIVQKFGGSSVADLSHMKRVAQRIKRVRDQGHQVVVVVSAVYGETDRLIQLSRSISNEVYWREYDALLATGEQASAALMSMILNAEGCEARSYNAMQARIFTNAQHGKASIHEIDIQAFQQDLKAGVIPVVAGFQGVSITGDFTTLGRGGSDLTAVMLAAALQADECQIFTDVDGVYTSDPRVVADARRLDVISYAEMWQLADLGAKVLQNSAVKAADRYRVSLRVLSSFSEGSGTLVTDSAVLPASDAYLLSGIALDRHWARLTVSGLSSQRQNAHHLLDKMAKACIDVDMLVQNTSVYPYSVDISFTVQRDHYEKALSISRQYDQENQYLRVLGDDAIGKLSLVGVGMKDHPAMAAKVLQILTQEGVGIQLITSSEAQVSTIVAEQQLALGAQILHTAFNLGVCVQSN